MILRVEVSFREHALLHVSVQAWLWFSDSTSFRLIQPTMYYLVSFNTTCKNVSSRDCRRFVEYSTLATFKVIHVTSMRRVRSFLKGFEVLAYTQKELLQSPWALEYYSWDCTYFWTSIVHLLLTKGEERLKIFSPITRESLANRFLHPFHHLLRGLHCSAIPNPRISK